MTSIGPSPPNRSPAIGDRRARAEGWVGAHWAPRILLRSAMSARTAELADRSMTVAAQLFTSIFPVLILLATWATRQDADRIAEAVSMPEQSRSTLEDAVAAAGDAAFGIVGAIVVLLSATGVSRALTRAFAAIWDLDRPKSSITSAWRWVSVVLALTLSLIAVRALGRLVDGVTPEGLWPAAVAMASDAAVALFVPWVLLTGSVRVRMLVPGAAIAALVGLAVRPATSHWLPQALEVSADRYGSIGVAFTYLTLLYVVALTLLATATLGRVIATDDGALGRWIRGRRSDPAAWTRGGVCGRAGLSSSAHGAVQLMP